MFYPKVAMFLHILCIDGKKWYSVKDISEFQDPNQMRSRVRFEHNKTKHYVPVVTEKWQNKEVEYDYSFPDEREFKPSDPWQISYLMKSRQSKPKDVGDKELKHKSLELKNNVVNTNIVHINRQKRPLRRRCPQMRKPKHLNSVAGRFLEVFQVVEFDHVSCSSNTGLEGTCLHEYDCEKTGGTSMGACADGYGTCCVTLFGCEGRSSAAVGWFNNPGYPTPSADRLSCTFTLDKFSAGITQIRLDFIHFELLPPTSGICELDQFQVLGHSVNTVIPILCGINSGHHVYIEILDGPLILSVQTVTAENRIFSIKVTQLTPSDELAAPTGCMQFFKEDHGHIESFNYRERSEIGITRIPSYLNNLNYAMCIKRATASCSITYTNVGEMQIVNYDTEGLPVIPPQQAGVEILNCPSDWLLIAALRLCGERLNDGSVIQDFALDAPVTDDGAGPIVVWFRSDGVYAGRGFRFYYQQNPCTT
ncbi:uncharacterized protein LOC120629976 [Pararge aegeria]|uniref:uncharacterized protein LOC120629976 n=1 Tax=Pararge aegeria TaxID=116150 RepID=UPI0019D14CA3|nr:uncharacterized protein LOC120629976 [Pararge aegeria]